MQQRIAHWLERQVNEYYAAEAAQKLSVPHNLRAILIFNQLVGYTGRYTLRLIEGQLGLADKMIVKGQLSACRGTFLGTLGLSYAHEIFRSGNGPISLDLITHHWRLYYIPTDVKMDADELHVMHLEILNEKIQNY